MARRTRALTAEQKSLLTTVRRVARQRSKINSAYVTAIVGARESGVTYASIADAVGTSSQAVQEIVRRHHSSQAREASERSDAGGPPAGAIAAVNGDGDGQSAGGTGGSGGRGPGTPPAMPSASL